MGGSMAPLFHSARKRITEDDGLVPVRSHGDEEHMDAGKFLQTLDIAPGVQGEIIDPPRPPNILRPTVQFLVDGPATVKEP